MLIGPSGIGKTMIGKALANEINCSFFYKNASEFDNKYVGSGAKTIRELF